MPVVKSTPLPFDGIHSENNQHFMHIFDLPELLLFIQFFPPELDRFILLNFESTESVSAGHLLQNFVKANIV